MSETKFTKEQLLINEANAFYWAVNADSSAAPASLNLLLETEMREKLIANKFDDLAKSGNYPDPLAVATEAMNSEPGAALVKSMVIEQLGKMGELSERSITLLAQDAQDTGWHHFVPFSEYDTVRNLLLDKLSEAKPSVVNDISFLVNEIIPWAKANGLKGVAGLIGKSKSVTAKARAAVPQMRSTMTNAANETQMKAELQNVLDLIGDKTKTEADIRDNNPESNKRVPSFEVVEYITADNESVLVMRVNPRQRAWVENGLGDRAKWEVGAKWPTSVKNV